MGTPALHAVIEVPSEVPPFLKQEVPPRPWPSHVRLYAETAPAEIALVVGTLATYGAKRPRGIRTFRALASAMPTVAPGGLAATDGSVVIRPSCCCGLETWRDWQSLLETGDSPWLGHGPAPWVEVLRDEFVVWSNSGSGGDSVRFSGQQLRDAVSAAARDLSDFVGALREWVLSRDAELADPVASRFAANFHVPRASSPP